jgi:hypothetical protein
MTFIVAVPCKDGVVLASDGQATIYTRFPTASGIARVETKVRTQKIFELGNNRLWACSGSEKDITRFWDMLRRALDNTKNRPLTNLELKECLGDFFLETMFAARKEEEHQDLPSPYPLRCPEYLVVGHQKHPVIWRMTGDCDSNFYDIDQCEITEHIVFAIGSLVGQWITHAFFNNLIDIGLERTPREYSLEQGSLIAYRLVKEVIKIDGLVGEPTDVWTVANNEVEQKSEAKLKKLKGLCKKWVASEQRMASIALSSLD